MKYLNTILIFIVIVISTGLLIGNRFDFTWAGGSGSQMHASGFVDDREYQRGETISSNDEFIFLQFCKSDIWLDINTQVKLVDGRDSKCEIDIIQGRIMVNGKIKISTRELKTTVSGLTSFVHYSWLDRIEIMALTGITSINIPNSDTLELTQKSIRLSTMSPYEYENFDFEPDKSSSALFYRYADVF